MCAVPENSQLDELIQAATERAAVHLEVASAAAGSVLLEKDLERALLESLKELNEPAVANRKVPTPHWQPQPGNTDLLIPSAEAPRALTELKWCSENKVFEALWDLLKMAWATETESVEATYLVYGAPQQSWDKPVQCAREIFFANTCDIARLIRHQLDWWERWILPGGVGRPLLMPRLIQLRLVAEPTLEIAGKPWQIRAIAVVPETREPIPFENGLPPERLPTDAIESHFSEGFRRWEISLPVEDVIGRRGGHIFKGGWHIGYIWGEEEGEPNLEFLSQHRMTSDSHERIYASGRVERLEAPLEFMVFGKDATEEEKGREQERYTNENRRIYGELRELGLLPPAGQNLTSHDINEHLRAGRDKG